MRIRRRRERASLEWGRLGSSWVWRREEEEEEDIKEDLLRVLVLEYGSMEASVWILFPLLVFLLLLFLLLVDRRSDGGIVCFGKGVLCGGVFNRTHTHHTHKQTFRFVKQSIV